MRGANEVPVANGGIPDARDEGPMTDMSEGIARNSGARAPRIAKKRARAFAGMALAMTALFAACEGDNLFSGDGPSFQPRVLGVVLPSAVFAGDTVQIRVDATARRQVAQILVSARGAATRDTAITLDEPRTQLSAIVKVVIPELLQDTLLIVSAQVADAAGVLSSPAESSTPAFGPPVVTSVSGPTGVRPGDAVTLRVNAFGARRLTRIDVSARGAITRDTSVLVSPPRNSVSQDLIFQIPAAVQDTLITFNVTAQDEAGFGSQAVPAMVAFAIDSPMVAVVTPASVQAGTTLHLAVNAQSVRPLTTLGVELRGGVIQNLSFPVSPNRTNVLEFLTIQLPAGISQPEIRVRVSALDKAGTQSWTDVQSIAVPVAGPVIFSVDPFTTSVNAGHFVDVRVTVTGDQPITSLRARWRGFAADKLAELTGGPETVFTLNPPRLNPVEDIEVESPCVRADAVFLMLTTARDANSILSAVNTQTITVLGNSLCELPLDSVPIPDTTSASLRRPAAGGNLPAALGSVRPPEVVLYSAPGAQRQPALNSNRLRTLSNRERRARARR